MDASRKPLAKVEGRRRMPLSGLTIAWRGTPSLDDWVAYIVKTTSKKFILADHASERKVKNLLSRLRTMSKKEVGQLAKGSKGTRARMVARPARICVPSCPPERARGY
jgi:hypothetical protein